MLEINKKGVIRSFKYLTSNLTYKYHDLIKIIWFLPPKKKEDRYNLFLLIDIEKVPKKFGIEIDRVINEISNKENIKIDLNIYDFEHFWKFVKKYSPILMFQIRRGICVYDPSGLFFSIKKLLISGRLPGTEEFASVLSKVSAYQLKYVESYYASQVLNEILNSVVSASQAPLALIGERMPKPTQVASSLKENLVKRRLLEKKYPTYINRIVKYFKVFEHGKIKRISWTKLFSLYEIAKNVVDRMETLVDEIVSLSQIYETRTEEIDEIIKKHK